MRYGIAVTVNSPKGEYDYPNSDVDDINEYLERVRSLHPSATSVNAAIVFLDKVEDNAHNH